MRITLHDVSKGRGGQALPLTNLEFHTGAVRFALAETEQRPTVLGLIASGRMRPDSGRVTLDGAENAKELRRRVALVDAPDASDPHADITLAGVVGEELMFAGVGATPVHARRWLAQLGFAELASVPIGTVDPAARVRIMCELAVLRDGVEGIVLVAPDRHGGSPDGWWRIAGEFADRGYAMLVIIGGSAAVALERMQEFDAINASGPIEPLVLEESGTTSGADTPDVGPVDPGRPTSGVSSDEPDADEPDADEPALRRAQGPLSDDAPAWVAEPVEASDTDNETPTENGGVR
ncbi:hypothetical protein GCM10010458_24280 [Microbacterium luteolum]|uniref:ABC transporter ATP-binding protein n=1 Tax=Microbacterium luteolum TaxID=69367 RepID=A0ABY7XVE1_MICLT|nr:hypothetical protein [Microbacterium luteolum]WDM45064.1 hypothetical protein KV395_18225 [Microbacterium luteolum]